MTKQFVNNDYLNSDLTLQKVMDFHKYENSCTRKIGIRVAKCEPYYWVKLAKRQSIRRMRRSARLAMTNYAQFHNPMADKTEIINQKEKLSWDEDQRYWDLLELRIAKPYLF
jgi:hypothetical protein